MEDGNAVPALPLEATPEAVAGLTMWEISAEPRAPKDTTVTRTVRHINSELLCPICLGILHNPVVVMECLHRFCSECIEKCLRLGRKECPSCRIHVPSRRSLRHDTNFDSLIHKIYPNLEEYEENEEKLIEDLNKNRNLNNAYTQSCRQGIQNQLRRRKPSTGPQAQVAGNKRRNEAAEGSPGKRQQPPGDNLVHFVLRRHPSESAVGLLEREFLRTSAEITVSESKFKQPSFSRQYRPAN